MFGEYSVPNSVSNGRPPANGVPCSAVWQASQIRGLGEVFTPLHRIGRREVRGGAADLAVELSERHRLAGRVVQRAGDEDDPRSDDDPDEDHHACANTNLFTGRHLLPLSPFEGGLVSSATPQVFLMPGCGLLPRRVEPYATAWGSQLPTRDWCHGLDSAGSSCIPSGISR